jgi:ribosomal protein S18 acetylase RimI-like enzyme
VPINGEDTGPSEPSAPPDRRVVTASTSNAAISMSELDSARFGYPIARANVTSVDDVRALVEHGREKRAAMIIIRVPADSWAAAQEIERVGGRLCDTLVYFDRSLEGPLPSASSAVRPADTDDIETIVDIAAAAFAGYGGHYHVDPRLDPAAADAGYVDWARRSVNRDRVLVIEDEQVVAGFVTMRDDDARSAEIMLNAIHPDHQRRGLYAALVGASLVASQDAGARRCFVSTQLWNTAVQRVWVRLGFEPATALHTFHLWLDGGGADHPGVSSAPSTSS